MDDSTFLLLTLLWSSIGTGYFIYGKKQRRAPALLAGVALCLFPYFLTNPWANLGVGLLLTAAPFALASIL